MSRQDILSNKRIKINFCRGFFCLANVLPSYNVRSGIQKAPQHSKIMFVNHNFLAVAKYF